MACFGKLNERKTCAYWELKYDKRERLEGKKTKSRQITGIAVKE